MTRNRASRVERDTENMGSSILGLNTMQKGNQINRSHIEGPKTCFISFLLPFVTCSSH